MKFRLVTLLLACTVLSSASLRAQYIPTTYTPVASAAWSIAHQGLMATNKASGTAATIGWTTTAGSTRIMVLMIMIGNGAASVSSVVDNATGGSSTYTLANVGTTSLGHSTTAGVSSVIYFSYVKSGATTITVTTTAGNYYMYGYEVTGLATSSPVDISGNTSNATGSGTSQAATTINCTNANDFIVSMDVPNAGAVTGVSAGYSDDDHSTGIGFTHFTSTAASSGNHTVTFTDNVSNDAYETSDAAFHQ